MRSSTFRIPLSLIAMALVCSFSRGAAGADPPTSQPAQSGRGAQTWRFPEEHFEIQAPGYLEKHSSKEEHMVLLLRSNVSRGPGTLHDVFNVVVTPLSNPPSLDVLVNAAQKKAAELHPEAKFDPVQRLVLDGAPAAVYAFTCKVGAQQAKEFRVLSVSHDRFYLIGFLCEASAGDQSELLLKRMLETFHWVD